ncbi:MAG: response regulator [Anaerolineae bacterium]
MTKKIRVLVADDHAVVRQGIRRFLEEAEDIEVVAETSDGKETLRQVADQRPDVVVLDIRMPEVGGVEAAQRIKTLYPDTRVLILTAYDDEPYIFALLQAGADGYLLKTASGDELIQAIRTVREGKTALSPEVARRVVQQVVSGKPGTAAEQVEPLTLRELEVLRLAARGFTNRAIGHHLNISPRTVQGHLASIYGKLGVNSRTEAVTEAIRRGWIVVE